MRLRNAADVIVLFDELVANTANCDFTNGTDAAKWWCAWKTAEMYGSENTRGMARLFLDGVEPISIDSIEGMVEEVRENTMYDVDIEIDHNLVLQGKEQLLSEEDQQRIDEQFEADLREWWGE